MVAPSGSGVIVRKVMRKPPEMEKYSLYFKLINEIVKLRSIYFILYKLFIKCLSNNTLGYQ